MYKKDINIYPPYYNSYFQDLDDNISLGQALEKRINESNDFFLNIPPKKWKYKYTDNKWSIIKVLRHIIDAELIFCNRALRIARGENNPLNGWDVNKYSSEIDETKIRADNILEALDIQLRQSKNLFAGFTENELTKVGNTSGYDVSVLAIGFMIYVHELHHRKIIINKYLK